MSLLDWFRPSVRIRRAFGKWIERLAHRFYEGPDPPRRLADEVKLFRMLYPDATADEWERFASHLAMKTYKDGFIRGYEWLERGWEGPTVEPEQLVEMQAHDWSLADTNPGWDKLLTTGYNPRDPLAGHDIEERRAIIEMLQGAQQGPYPIVIDLSAYEDDGFPGTRDEEDDEPTEPTEPTEPDAAEKDSGRTDTREGGHSKQHNRRGQGLLRRSVGSGGSGSGRAKARGRES